MKVALHHVLLWVEPKNEQLWNEANEMESALAGTGSASALPGVFAAAQLRKLEAMGFPMGLAGSIRHAAGPGRCVYAAWWALHAVKDLVDTNKRRDIEFPPEWAHIILLGVLKEMIAKIDCREYDRRGEYREFFDSYLGVRCPEDPLPEPNPKGYNDVLKGAIVVLENYGPTQRLEWGKIERERQAAAAT